MGSNRLLMFNRANQFCWLPRYIDRSFLGVNFGIGLVVSSLLFAIAHILNPFNPFKGNYNLFWGWGLWTFFSGLFFGFIREKTGSIVAAGIAHGLPDALGEAISKLSSFV